jgi:hypothetical protein
LVHIAGSNIVAGCTKRQRRHDKNEFATPLLRRFEEQKNHQLIEL